MVKCKFSFTRSTKNSETHFEGEYKSDKQVDQSPQKWNGLISATLSGIVVPFIIDFLMEAMNYL